MLFLSFFVARAKCFRFSSCPESMKKITPGPACGASTKVSGRIGYTTDASTRDRVPLRVRNQRSAGLVPDDSRRIIHPAPKEPPLGENGPFGVRPFRGGSAGPNPCLPLLMRNAPLFQYFSFPGNVVIIPRCAGIVNPYFFGDKRVQQGRFRFMEGPAACAKKRPAARNRVPGAGNHSP